MNKSDLPDDISFDLLMAKACYAMGLARPRRSNLRVGAAIFDTKNTVYVGANFEMNWQHSEHAEKTAILHGLCNDSGKVRAICIAAERKLFTPCGDCMDKIIEHATADCVIMHYNPLEKKSSYFRIKEIMPFYPTKE